MARTANRTGMKATPGSSGATGSGRSSLCRHPRCWALTTASQTFVNRDLELPRARTRHGPSEVAAKATSSSACSPISTSST
eukprot:6273923-Prymnesium_polylepis.2